MPINRYAAYGLTLSVLSLNGCMLLSDKAAAVSGDGPPLHHQDISKIPNATPKDEPRSRYGNPATYTVFGQEYKVMASSQGYQAEGTASWYGRKFHGRRTSSGEPYDVYLMTAAHKHLPLPTYAEVKNLDNNRTVIVKINDRGPFVDDRLIDLSYAAAVKLGITEKGTGKVRVTAINPKHAPRKATAQAQPSQHKPLTERFVVQLGAFTQRKNAEAVVEKTNQLSQSLHRLEAYIKTETINRIPHYRVQLGPFQSNQEASHVKQQLSQITDFSPHIVREFNN